MPREEKAISPEREQTDASLRVERQKADDVLGDKAAIEHAADAIIEKARGRADDLVARARARLDRSSAERGSGEAPTDSVQHERLLEDEVLRRERKDADDVLRTERERGDALLVAERGETDKDLSAERSRSDHAVATRDDFLGMVSHDLRNMLGSVVGFASLIATVESSEPIHPSEQVLEYARRIQRAGARMARLVGDLVDIASIDAGALAVSREPGDPCDVVAEAVETFQTEAASTGVMLVAELEPRPMRASFDPARLLQVLANLIGNAMKFTPSGGRVVVRVLACGDDVRFEVEDTGVGIAADAVGSVFERFHQVTRADRRGVGLGLYISKSIVHGHGGRIGVTSRPGEGSTFWFTFPRDAAA